MATIRGINIGSVPPWVLAVQLPGPLGNPALTPAAREFFRDPNNAFDLFVSSVLQNQPGLLGSTFVDFLRGPLRETFRRRFLERVAAQTAGIEPGQSQRPGPTQPTIQPLDMLLNFDPVQEFLLTRPEQRGERFLLPLLRRVNA